MDARRKHTLSPSCRLASPRLCNTTPRTGCHTSSARPQGHKCQACLPACVWSEEVPPVCVCVCARWSASRVHSVPATGPCVSFNVWKGPPPPPGSDFDTVEAAHVTLHQRHRWAKSFVHPPLLWTVHQITLVPASPRLAAVGAPNLLVYIIR